MADLIADLQLKSIACVQQREKDGDEIYVNFIAKKAVGGIVATERVPSDMGFWRMTNGRTEEMQHLLYIDEVGAGLEMLITVMEMDVLRIFKNSFSIVGTVIDDFVGQVKLMIDPSGKLTVKPCNNSERLTEDDKPDDGLHRFRLTGNKSEYILTLFLQIGGKSVG